MRFPSAAILIAAALLAPSRIFAAPSAQVPIFRTAQECHELYDRKLYTNSYYACYEAIDDISRQASRAADPVPLYLRQADLSIVIALDESALGNHEDAYRWAISAHQIAYDIFQQRKTTPRQDTLINDYIQRLLDIEAQESALINKKQS